MELEEDQNEKKAVRVFVGGLGESVTSEDLRKLFESLGTVQSLQTIRTKGRSLAYLDFLPSPCDPKSLSKLFSKIEEVLLVSRISELNSYVPEPSPLPIRGQRQQYNGCVWKGGKLRLEKAKEDYLTRLKKEWEEDALVTTDVSTHEEDLEEEMPRNKNTSLISDSDAKAKHLSIFFPRLRKVKSIPFSGTGKHKYSFQNIKVPPLPVHFCDCEEHCSPFVTEREKESLNRAAEIGGMDDEEIKIMNAVMNKLLEKEKVSNTKLLEKEQVSNTKHLEKEQVSNSKHLENDEGSFESPDALHGNECEVDSATDDDDDLIINIETKKNKAGLMGFQELQRIMENQSNKTNIAEEEPVKSTLQVQKRKNSNPNKVKKRKSLPELESESNGGVSSIPEVKSKMQTLIDDLGSGAQPTEPEYDFGELAKVSWSQKSSWRELVGEGGNAAFSASLILPKFDSDKDQQESDGPCTPSYGSDQTEDMESDGDLVSKPINAQVIEEPAEAQPANTQVIEEPAEAQLFEAQGIEEPVETQHNVAPKKTGRGASWLQKQSWTQLVNEKNNAFSISQILPGITLPEQKAMEPVMYPTNSYDCKHDGVEKTTINGAVIDGFKLREIIPENSEHAVADDIASGPVAEKKIEASSREKSTAVVEIGKTCSFMRSEASLKEWAKAKAAVSASLKRKRGEK